VIDEAQNLSQAALEELRMLSNLETEKSKLLQIVMVGQPNLRDKLAAPELEQLRQRITVSYHLLPLDAAETANYINHRLLRAALGAPLQFPREVTDTIHARSRGVPRIINVICDAALVFGYAEERRQIDLPLIRDVLGELETTGILPAGAGVDVSPALMPEPSETAVPAAAATAAAPQPVAGIPAAVREQVLARAAREAEERTALIAQREEALLQRERELAEQRRVLAEEYRLLRSQRAHAATAAAPVFSGDRVQVRQASSGGRFQTARPEGVKGWLKRVLLGGSQPAVEN
jgi:hypothetical protein